MALDFKSEFADLSCSGLLKKQLSMTYSDLSTWPLDETVPLHTPLAALLKTL